MVWRSFLFFTSRVGTVPFFYPFFAKIFGNLKSILLFINSTKKRLNRKKVHRVKVSVKKIGPFFFDIFTSWNIRENDVFFFITHKIFQISQFWWIFTKVLLKKGVKYFLMLLLAKIKEHKSNSPILYKKVQKG